MAGQDHFVASFGAAHQLSQLSFGVGHRYLHQALHFGFRPSSSPYCTKRVSPNGQIMPKLRLLRAVSTRTDDIN